VNFSINDQTSASVTFGTPALLKWETFNTLSGNACHATNAWSGNKSSTPGQVYSQSTGNLPVGSYTFKIECDGPLSSTTGIKTVSLNVTAGPAPTVDISCNSQQTFCDIQTGQTASIAWSSQNSTSCTVAPENWSGVSGTRNTVALNTTTIYIANCTDGTINVTDQVEVRVTPVPPSQDFSISCSPATQTIVVGSSFSFTLNSTAINGFNSPVTFSLNSIAPNSGTLPSVSFINNGQVPSATTQAIITTTTSTTPSTV
jgi:hypothetical protein